MLTPIKSLLLKRSPLTTVKSFPIVKMFHGCLILAFTSLIHIIPRKRGLNEHTYGLIRQYLPKKTDFTQISKEEIINIQDKLNNRPRKVLGYKTPYEVFFKEFAKKLAA